MLIDRADRVMNVCEIKFSRSEFEIDKNYEADLRTRYWSTPRIAGLPS